MNDTGPVARGGALLAACAALVLGCQRPTTPTPDPVKRGEVLVKAGGCNDCHTPMKFDEKLGMPVPQMDRMLSGHPQGAPAPKSTLAGDDQAVIGPTFTSFRLPFGVVYAANITSDERTGLGTWNEKMFIATMRTGKHAGIGRPVLPPMPWMDLNELSDEDLGAIFAYLRTVPAVSNPVPPPDVPPGAYAEIGKGYEALLAAAPKP
ncbi:MAG TPA: hypothetical protein VIF15_15750 [Polyangiaceae bacterium]|jgi:hypothetical protein